MAADICQIKMFEVGKVSAVEAIRTVIILLPESEAFLFLILYLYASADIWISQFQILYRIIDLNKNFDNLSGVSIH